MAIFDCGEKTSDFVGALEFNFSPLSKEVFLIGVEHVNEAVLLQLGESNNNESTSETFDSVSLKSLEIFSSVFFEAKTIRNK